MIYYIGAFGLIFIGLYTIAVKRNLIKMIIGLSLIDTGVNMLIVAIGYVSGRTAPILTGTLRNNPIGKVVDPIPQALVLTAIVIGVAVLALALSIVVNIYQNYGTLDVKKIRRLRW